MKVRDLFLENEELRREDLVFLLCELLDCNPSEIDLQTQLSPAKQALFQGWAKRLREHEPPQYIIHKSWFYGLEFYVDHRVLIPRYDTESLLEAVMKLLSGNEKVLEIGLGSGAISITLKHIFPSLDITATDIDPAAIEIAKHNADRHETPIRIVQADLFPDFEDRYDLIISNPPYISPDEYNQLSAMVRCYEPRLALYAEGKGLDFYRRILAKAEDFLRVDGILAFEHGATQQNELIGLTEKRGFEILQKGRDLANRDRFLILKKILNEVF